jgi:polyisoprenoid-binding protein YceI
VDPADPKGAKAGVEFYVDSLATGVGMRDRKMRGDFLDALHHPKITLTMTSLSPLDSSRYEVRGTLNIHGQSKAVVAPTTAILAPDSSSVATRGRFQIKLSDFGIGQPRFLFNVMHDQLDIIYDLLWVRQP